MSQIPFSEAVKDVDKLTEEHALELVKVSEYMKNIIGIDRFRNQEFCNKAFSVNKSALRYIPEEFKTQEMCEEAVKWSGHCFAYVPDKLKTLQMCINAEKHSSRHMTEIPDRLLNAFFDSFSEEERNEKIECWEEKTERKYHHDFFDQAEASETEQDADQVADQDKNNAENVVPEETEASNDPKNTSEGDPWQSNNGSASFADDFSGKGTDTDGFTDDLGDTEPEVPTTEQTEAENQDDGPKNPESAADQEETELVRKLNEASQYEGRMSRLVRLCKEGGEKYSNLRQELMENISVMGELVQKARTLEDQDADFEKGVSKMYEERMKLLADPLCLELEKEPTGQDNKTKDEAEPQEETQKIPGEIMKEVQEAKGILENEPDDPSVITDLGRIPPDRRSAGVCLAMVSEDGLCLQDVPDKVLEGPDGEKIRMTAVTQNGLALEFIPENLRSGEICAAAIRQNGNALKFLNTGSFRNSDICLEAVRQDGLALQYVRPEEKTPDLCLLAYTGNHEAMEFIPENLRKHVLEAADSAGKEQSIIESLQNGEILLKDVGLINQTYEVCQAAVETDPMQLEYVMQNYLRPELCLMAVEKNGQALRYVPEDMRDSVICNAALTQNNDAWVWVPESLRDEDLYRTVVRNDCWNLQYVPDQYKTVVMCEDAVADNGLVLQFVGERLISPLLCLMAIHSNSEAVEYLPKDMDIETIRKKAVAQKGSALALISVRTKELCEAAVSNDGLALQFVPENLLSEDLILKAVTENGKALRFVPENLRTEGICKEAVKSSADALQYVPEDIRDQDLCYSAVSRNGLMLRFVPENLRTPEMCISAVTRNALASQYVPENLVYYVESFYSLNSGRLKYWENKATEEKNVKNSAYEMTSAS